MSKAAVEQRCESLSKSCPLRSVPKERVYPAFLPRGVGTHGNTTGNVVEVSHGMMEAVRPEPSLFKSIRIAVEVLHRQDERKREEYVQSMAANLGVAPSSVLLDAEAPTDMLPPSVNRELQESLSTVNRLPRAERRTTEKGDDHTTFRVPDLATGDILVVSPMELHAGNYEAACDCLNNANVSIMCIHVQRAILDSKSNKVLFVKPWQKVGTSRHSIHTRSHGARTPLPKNWRLPKQQLGRGSTRGRIHVRKKA